MKKLRLINIFLTVFTCIIPKYGSKISCEHGTETKGWLYNNQLYIDGTVCGNDTNDITLGIN